MSRLLVALAVALSGLTVLTGTPAAAGPGSVERTLDVTGTGVGMYPEYSQRVDRYGITTTDATTGSVTVTATTSGWPDSVSIEGQSASGETTVTGLESGDEISVVFDDGGRRQDVTLVYLPSRFPRLEITVDRAGTAPGRMGLTLSRWNGSPDHFEVLLDRHGVPAHVERVPGSSMDLRRQDDGTVTVSRPTTTPGRTGHALHVLDDEMGTTSVRETVGLVDTDGHDSIVLPTGNVVLLSHEWDSARELTDSVIQEIDPDGEVVFQWNSADHIDVAGETTVPDLTEGEGEGRGDYAHVTSIQVTADGNWLASFRHTSSVMKIARTAHGVHGAGDVIWRLGGWRSDFTFLDDPYLAGPCAQHTASELGNGNILVFDNGSAASHPLCVDPAAGTVPAERQSVARPLTRITEYRLDEAEGTARLVRSYDQDHPVEDRTLFTLFGGSAQRLSNGNTVIGWGSEKAATVTEIDAEGKKVWEVRDPNPDEDQRFVSDRAFKFYGPERYRPDLWLELGGLSGNDSYGKGQRGPTRALTPRHRTAVNKVGLQNDGNVSDRFRVEGRAGSRSIRVAYRHAGKNVTRKVVAGSWRTPRLLPGESVTLKVRMTRTKRAEPGHRRRIPVTGSSLGDPTVQDRFAVIARVRR